MRREILQRQGRKHRGQPGDCTLSALRQPQACGAQLVSPFVGQQGQWVALALDGIIAGKSQFRSLSPQLRALANKLGNRLWRPAAESFEGPAQLLHFDVKPANTLWYPHNEILQLCDFGMAEPAPQRSARPSPRFSTYVTKLYRPPELWTIRDGEEQTLLRALTPAVDVWSFGCVLFEAAAGKALMLPQDSLRSSCGHSVASWSQVHPELVLAKHGRRPAGPGLFLWFQARLSAAGPLQQAVLAALHPDPDRRAWCSLKP